MSDTVSQPIVSAPSPEHPPEWRTRAWRGWLKWIAVVVACLWVADTGISLVIQHTALKGRLTARLAAAFGRPVTVEGYAFRLWTGPELEAYSVRVGEDPRFGHEYVVRAESLTLRLRLRSFFAGHLELGTISLSHPSLNLFRNADGDWNHAEWLPRPENSAASATDSAAPVRARKPVPRFHQIEVSDGRINFKRGDEKLPFAFVHVDGTLETEAPGRWRLDLVAVPDRAAVVAQDPGVLHLLGHVGGTSSRLRPAILEIDWTDASISDVLRLATGRDYGLRGTLGVSVAARTEGDAWILGTKLLLSRLHRWDLPLRADNPSVSVVATERLDPSGARLELTHAQIDLPHSNAAVAGALDWTRPALGLGGDSVPRQARKPSARRTRQSRNASRGTELHVVSSSISLSDLLDWARAFHPAVAEGVALGGFAQLDAKISGWPPHLEEATFNLARGALIGTGMPSVRFGPLTLRYGAGKGITLPPATIAVGAPTNSFRVDAFATPATGAFSVRVRGGTSNVRDVIAAAQRLGWDLARGWNIAGPAHCDLLWERAAFAEHAALAGSVDWGTPSDGVSLRAPFLNRPVEQIHARAELKTDSTRLTLTSARAFGTIWAGSLQHKLSHGWKFSLSGNSVSAAELDRWLDPRWRESFLDRVLPFLSSPGPATAALESLRARGTLALGDFRLAPVAVRHLRGDLHLDGRHLQLSNISGQFEKGRLAGDFEASFDSTARYEATLDFSLVALQALSADFPSLAGVFEGSPSARIHFSLRGASRSALLRSLECRGTASAKDLAVGNLSLPRPAVRPDQRDPGPAASRFADASAAFSCRAGTIQFQRLMLDGGGVWWEGTGSVDFARNLDLRLHLLRSRSSEPSAELADAKTGSPSAVAPTEYRIVGTLKSPRVEEIPISPHAQQKR